jgi:hypothetical protein
MATSPLKAALPVPSMIVLPRMTMSCMRASHGRAAQGRAKTCFCSSNIA